jgi:hypothetical protein
VIRIEGIFQSRVVLAEGKDVNKRVSCAHHLHNSEWGRVFVIEQKTWCLALLDV